MDKPECCYCYCERSTCLNHGFLICDDCFEEETNKSTPLTEKELWKCLKSLNPKLQLQIVLSHERLRRKHENLLLELEAHIWYNGSIDESQLEEYCRLKKLNGI